MLRNADLHAPPARCSRSHLVQAALIQSFVGAECECGERVQLSEAGFHRELCSVVQILPNEQDAEKGQACWESSGDYVMRDEDAATAAVC